MFMHKLIIISFLATGLLGLEDKIPLLFNSGQPSYAPSFLQRTTGYSPQLVQHRIRILGMELRSHLSGVGYQLQAEMHQLQSGLRRQNLL